MTTEEAIKIISECPNCKKLIDGECNEETGECFEAKRMAIEALEKQIPEKPKKYGEAGWYGCPNCGTPLESIHIFLGRCKCGQALNKLDGSDEE